MRPSLLLVLTIVLASSCQLSNSERVGSAEGLIPLPVFMEVDSMASGLQVPSATWNWQVETTWNDQSVFWKTWLPGQPDDHRAHLVVEKIEGVPAEGYQLRIAATDGVWIGASDEIGVFRALTTLRQLLPVEMERSSEGQRFILPALEIQDAPRFEHRGLLLDCCRHFMEPALSSI